MWQEDDISRVNFDFLLTYLYMGPRHVHLIEEDDFLLSQDFLVSVIKLSSFFDIDDGIKREFIRRGNKLHPALQFELARCFGIDPWIEHAFRRLMDMSLTSLDSAQVAQIGHCGYFWLTQTKAKIQALRTKIAFHVPPIVNSPDCNTADTCLQSWTREWEERVRQFIHHPEQPISCVTLLHQLSATVKCVVVSSKMFPDI
ncbi:hypothetical protein B0H13DRAFT_1871839 [Mycena leptocephala]|nr:hypothetical protein B0H13DRAFT_1871839 [Mycena leptocephala]